MNAQEFKYPRTVNGRQTLEYQTWKGIQRRCHDPENAAYKHYGGRGIVVCDRWRASFDNFMDDMGYKPIGKRHTLERKNNDGNYCPENCKWATYFEQGQNRRDNVQVTIDGVTRTVSEWSRVSDLNVGVVAHRYRRGERGRALLKPVYKWKPWIGFRLNRDQKSGKFLPLS